jgi:hypothetical protein
MSRTLALITIAVATVCQLTIAQTTFAQNGAVVHLVHPDSISGVDTSSNQDRGIVIRTLRGFDLAAVKVRLDLAVAGDITVTVYNVDGGLRGQPAAVNTIAATDLGNVEHTVPLTCFLDACTDYEIAVEFDAVDGWDYFEESATCVPYQSHDIALVNSATDTGSDATRLPHLALVGQSPGGTLMDLSPFGSGTCEDSSTDRSLFVRPLQTLAVSAIGFDYDPPAGLGTLQARIYHADDYSRGALVAEGSLELTTDGRRLWQIPVNAVLREGHLYEVATIYPAGRWSCRLEAGLGLPIEVGGVIEVLDGARDGDPGDPYLPHFRLQWESQVGGVTIDLGQSSGLPPFSSTDASLDRSVYVFPVSDQEAFSVGWYADVPDGETITARIYTASGVVRGTLQTEGSVVSTGGGERWHDIPVASALFGGLQGYELNVSFGSVNLWRHWIVGSDYYVTPELQVYSAGAGGTGAPELPYMRLNACYEYTTSIGDGPARPAGLVLRAPHPNPVTGESFLDYEIDREGAASIRVFDVRGRLVATLLDDASLPAGPGTVSLRAGDLPAGVYFVRLETRHASVSRKIMLIK